ncbi:hypothetical protein SKAU_G00328690 [Synaphobranchus kaupii]|uniref:Uncharacterized protein n=1 Tax=Synaphobranchus kaupii TaxID=118154 RepID=A0A9Q1EQ41_SYNKA|nr:hypothetical protein SKAU_G00328690 [Synaphobranchus kaupii]
MPGSEAGVCPEGDCPGGGRLSQLYREAQLPQGSDSKWVTGKRKAKAAAYRVLTGRLEREDSLSPEWCLCGMGGRVLRHHLQHDLEHKAEGWNTPVRTAADVTHWESCELGDCQPDLPRPANPAEASTISKPIA